MIALALDVKISPPGSASSGPSPQQVGDDLLEFLNGTPTRPYTAPQLAIPTGEAP